MQSTSQGGLHFPNLYHYWCEAQLAQMVKLHHSPEVVGWVSEAQVLLPLPLKAFLWYPRVARPQSVYTNPILKHTFTLWDKLKHDYKEGLCRFFLQDRTHSLLGGGWTMTFLT